MNLTLAAIVGQVGCITIVVILVALLAGLWADNQFDTSPMFTLLLLVVSMPVTLFLMFRVVRAGTARMQFDQPEKSQTPTEEE